MENETAATQTYVDRIIAKFGRMADLARALGHQNVTTVQGWKERGVIPARQQPLVLDAGRDLKVPVTMADFFPAQDEPSQREGAAA